MIVVFGSINLDLVARVARLPRPGETITGSVLRRAAGRQGRQSGARRASRGRRRRDGRRRRHRHVRRRRAGRTRRGAASTSRWVRTRRGADGRRADPRRRRRPERHHRRCRARMPRRTPAAGSGRGARQRAPRCCCSWKSPGRVCVPSRPAQSDAAHASSSTPRLRSALPAALLARPRRADRQCASKPRTLADALGLPRSAGGIRGRRASPLRLRGDRHARTTRRHRRGRGSIARGAGARRCKSSIRPAQAMLSPASLAAALDRGADWRRRHRRRCRRRLARLHRAGCASRRCQSCAAIRKLAADTRRSTLTRRQRYARPSSHRRRRRRKTAPLAHASRCRRHSNRHTAVAAATLSDSTPACIGIVTRWVACAASSAESPAPSLPMASAIRVARATPRTSDVPPAATVATTSPPVAR